jgi:hypothetical protein
MHSPKSSPQALYKLALLQYERQFRCKAPQWLRTLCNTNVRSLLGVSKRLNWRLPTQILVETEGQSGPESLWAERQIRLDFETEIMNRGWFEPRNLQDLPIDPAEAAAISCRKRGDKKWAK